jgi:hypothetical protein
VGYLVLVPLFLRFGSPTVVDVVMVEVDVAVVGVYTVVRAVLVEY